MNKARLHDGYPYPEILDGFDTRILCHPAFEKPNTYRGVDMRFVLIGDKGAVDFLLCTNWHIHDIGEKHKLRYPIAANIGLHRPGKDKCQWLGKCNWERITSGETCWQALIHGGDQGVFVRLKEIYENRL